MLQPAPKKKYVPTAKEKKNLEDASSNKNMRPPFTPEEKKKMPKVGNMGSAKSGKSMKKAQGGTKFGMLSVKAGVDDNPNPTAADRIAGAKKNAGKAKSGTKIKKAMSGYGGKAASMVPPKKKAMMGNTMMKSGGKMKTCKGGC
tara:strand:- start:31 stop:462 length:432 start_codon:yes stop_codon:yes gene_type:complete